MGLIIASIIIGATLAAILYFHGLDQGKRLARAEKNEYLYSRNSTLQEMLRMRNEQIRAGQKGIARLRKKIIKLQQELNYERTTRV